MSNHSVITVEGLGKRFGGAPALDEVSLEIQPGHIVGLLGANGSGKSTLMRHFVGLYLPDTGTCTTLGRDAARLGPDELARIGYVHQEGHLTDWMRVSHLVEYVSSYYTRWNKELAQDYVSRFDLDDDAFVGTLSPGQRQKLAILLAIGHEPTLLILDEPAAALDPLARQDFLELLLGIIQDPSRTVVISSHILSDVEKVIDHVVILDRGAVRRDVSFDDLREEFTKMRISTFDGSLPEQLPFVDALSCRRSDAEAVLVVPSRPREELEHAGREVGVTIEFLPLALDEIYRLVLEPTACEARS
ncbi:MAG: hypothetical protein CMJ83_17280 [Planctomycetes bacterium]|nr:hypothetical protein [Planctomycetota bacterium]